MTHICVGNVTIIGSDNGLSPERRQAITWTNAGLLLIRPLGTNFSEMVLGIQTSAFKKMHFKISSAKWRLFGLGLNKLMDVLPYPCPHIIIPPAQRSCWGYIGFTPSVRPSVGPSVPPPACRVRSVAPTVLVGSISYLYILSSNFRRCVACIVFSKISKLEFLVLFKNL